MTDFFLYLLEVTTCQAIFCLLYLIVFRNLSFFQLNRFYLLTATLISFIIPLISIPFWSVPDTIPSLNYSFDLQNLTSPLSSSEGVSAHKSFFSTEWLMFIIVLVYFTGFSIRFIKLIGGITKLLNLVKTSEIKDYDGIKTVHISQDPSFFAFLNYVFINTTKLDLSNAELRQVLSHEKSHIVQKHSWDNLFMELSLLICWFNPFLRIMKKELNNTHEFYADRQAAGTESDVSQYSSLILKLSANQSSRKPYLSHQFSMINIKQRIIMLNKQKKPTRIALRYFAIIPCLALLLVMFSFTKKSPLTALELSESKIDQTIGNITWNGNSLYSDSYLTDFLELNAGDKFNEDEINKKLVYKADGSDLASLYMDQGYLFFTVEMKKTRNNDKVDLTFNLNEGKVMTIGKVTVTGNKEIKTEEILEMIELKAGDVFNRSKLISSQKNIMESGLFVPEKITPTPIPHPEEGKVDIEFEVVEL